MASESTIRRLTRPACGPRQQRGAAAIFAAIGLVGVLAASGLAIDLGQIYLAQRDLQRLANAAALDVVSGAGGCQAGGQDRLQLAQSLARASIERNDGDPAWLAAGGLRLGRMRSTNGLREFVATGNPAAAVAAEVQLRRPFPRRLLNLPGLDAAAPMQVTAAARRAPLVNLAVNTAPPQITDAAMPYYNALLGGPGGPAGFVPATIQPLLDATVPVSELLPAIFGEEIRPGAQTPEIDVPSFLGAIANALYGTADAAAAAVQDIASSSEGMNRLIPGDVITVPPDYDQVGQATVPVFELVRDALAAARDQIVALAPPTTIGPFIAPDLVIEIEEPGRTVLGPAVEDGDDFVSEARSALVRVGLTTGIGTSLGEPLRLALEARALPSRARVQRIRCASRDRAQNGAEIGVQTGAASLRILDDQPLLRLDRAIGPGGSPLTFPVSIEVYASSAADVVDPTFRMLDFEGPFPEPQTGEIRGENSQVVGGSAVRGLDNALFALSDNLQLRMETNIDTLGTPVAGALLAEVNRLFRSEIQPAIRAALIPALLDVDDQFLLPLMEAAGAQIPATRVTVFDVRVPRPALFAQR